MPLRLTGCVATLGGLMLWQLAFPTPAYTQSHPCEQAPPATVTIQSGAPHRVTWCSPLADHIEALVAFVDGTPTEINTVTAKTQASAAGLVLYESPLFLQVAKGAHILRVAAYNRNQFTGQLQLGAQSANFPFDAVEDTPPPTAPAIKGVTR